MQHHDSSPQSITGPRLSPEQLDLLTTITDLAAGGTAPTLSEVTALNDADALSTARALGALEAHGYLVITGTAITPTGLIDPEPLADLTEIQIRILEMIQRSVHATGQAPHGTAIASVFNISNSQARNHVAHLARRGYLFHPPGRITAAKVLKPLDLGLAPKPIEDPEAAGADLTSEALGLLLVIQDHLRRDGAVPSIAELGRESGLKSISQSVHHLRLLVARGYVSYPHRRVGAMVVHRPVLRDGETFEVKRPAFPVLKDLPLGPPVPESYREVLQIVVTHLRALNYCPSPTEVAAMSFSLTSDDAQEGTAWLIGNGYLRRVSSGGAIVELMQRPPLTPEEVAQQRAALLRQRRDGKGLTDRQRAILTVIHDHIVATGKSPIYKTIQETAGPNSIPGVNYQLKNLAELGYLEPGELRSNGTAWNITRTFRATDGRELGPIAGEGRTTPAQDQVLEVIRDQIATTGSSGTAEEIGAAVGISTSMARNYIRRLKGLGLIARLKRNGSLVLIDQENTPES